MTLLESAWPQDAFGAARYHATLGPQAFKRGLHRRTGDSAVVLNAAIPNGYTFQLVPTMERDHRHLQMNDHPVRQRFTEDVGLTVCTTKRV